MSISADLCIDHTQEGGDTVLTLSQKKFCADGDTSNTEDYMWKVPVNVKVQGKDGIEKFLLENKKMEYRLKGVEPSSWIKVCTYLRRWSVFVRSVYASILDSLCHSQRPYLTDTVKSA